MNPDIYKECPDNNGHNCEAIWGVLANFTESPIGEYNAVMIEYCDGASFSSNREDPITVNGRQIWFRGRRNLDAMLAYLDQLGGLLSNSTEVILTGDSAGGLATYMHANAVAGAVQSKSPKAKVVAVPGAGYFLDTPRLRPGFQNAIGPALWNATSDPACLAANPDPDTWKCWFAQYVYQYITIPVFVVNSAYDPTQVPVNCDLDHNGCNPQQMAQIEAFAAEIRGNVSASAAGGGNGNRDGFFVTACHQHEHTCQWRDWDGIIIDGSKMREVSGIVVCWGLPTVGSHLTYKRWHLPHCRSCCLNACRCSGIGTRTVGPRQRVWPTPSLAVTRRALPRALPTAVANACQWFVHTIRIGTKDYTS
jgi:hypothetical protein